MKKRNLFNLSRHMNLTCGLGSIYPLGAWEIIPGDTFQCNTSLLIRTTPLLSPIMHPVHVRLHYWYVPNRLVWDDWEEFITGGPDGTSTPEHPYVNVSSVASGHLWNYLGLPVETFGATEKINALPVRAVSLIWNEHYRDQDLATARVIDTTAGADTTTDLTLPRSAWPRDYFTTARPWEQRGTAVTIPLTTDDVGVYGDGMSFSGTEVTGNKVQILDAKGGAAALKMLAADGTITYGAGTNDGTSSLRADLSSTQIAISDMRESMGLQKFMEDMATNGARYVEYLRFLGISGRHIDSRLSLPEYLGGGKSTLQFSEILSTADTGTSDVGDMKGHGIGVMRSNRFRRFFEEHGWVIPLLSVVPQPMYMNGIPRKFSRTTKEDYFQGQLAYIGEQEILNKELYAPHGTPDGTFGYAPRYDEYRSENSFVAGDFATSSLNHWHMARDFGSNPSLNETFIECTPTDRVFQSTSTDNLLITAFNKCAARRMIPKRATKKLIG